MLRERLQRLGLDKKLRAIYDKYERILIPTFLVVGFVFDVVTFRALQIRAALQLLMIYAVMVGLMLAYMHIYDAKREPPKWAIFSYLRFLAPFIAQISVGALLSSALLFYWFSGSFSVSWPLFALITGVMISSEVFRHIYLRPEVQFAVYNFVLMSYLSVLLPFAVRSLSGWLFILSGVISTLIVLMLILLVGKFAPKIRQQKTKLLVSVLSIFVVMSSFYYLKLIPPLPLSIREAGIYHDIQRSKGEYTFLGEDENVLDKLLPGQVIHVQPGDSIYAYSAIFAPADLSTAIFHRWQYKDPDSGKWVDSDLLRFTIRGGRQEGYRGYTVKTGLTPGKWRVTVQNARGQVLGRLLFTVAEPE